MAEAGKMSPLLQAVPTRWGWQDPALSPTVYGEHTSIWDGVGFIPFILRVHRGCVFLPPFTSGVQKRVDFSSPTHFGSPPGVHFPSPIHSGGPQRVGSPSPIHSRGSRPASSRMGIPGGCFAAPGRYREGLWGWGGWGSTGGARPGTCTGGGGGLCYWSGRQPMSGGGCLLRRADKKHRVGPRRRAQRWERGWG